MNKHLPHLLRLFALLALLLVAAPVHAQDSPYTTGAWGPGGYLYPSQDGYTPLDEVDLPLSGAEDMFYAPDGFLYVADTGNGRIVKFNTDLQQVAEFGKDILQAPTGICVDADGTLYITDATQNTVVILGADGSLINEFGRPTEPLFGENREFLPRKIAVDARKNLYIVSEGSVDGLVMMNTDGRFIGYFGANAADMSLKMILQRLFLTKEQLDQFIKNEAASPSSVAVDSQSLVYTATAGTERYLSLRRFTISGKNLFPGTFGSKTFRDLDVSEDGLLVAVDADGSIFEYDLNETLLFTFGTKDAGDQRLGLLNSPSAIERVGENLYVLDKDKNAIIIFGITDFARQVHRGVSLFIEGLYDEAKPYFEDVLTRNGLFIMAYQGIADAYYKQDDYPNALLYYRYAEDRGGYSETFWEQRNAILQKYLGSALVLLFAAWVASSLFWRVERRTGWLNPLRRGLRGLTRFRLVDDFVFMFRFIKQPADSFYYIKYNLRGSLFFAFLIYGWVLVSRVLTLYVTGFLFSPYDTLWMIHPETEITYVVGFFVLWNAANYMIATITDGEGRLRHVIIGSAYSLFPYALLALPIALISNLLTLNEAFLFSFSSQVMLLWSGLMLVIMVKEVHNYSLSETTRNILTTLFTMAIFLLTAYILYVLFNQLYEFVQAVLQEISLHG